MMIDYHYLAVNIDFVTLTYYPHQPIGKMWIYHLLFFVCVFVRIRISPLRIKLAASLFARRFIGVQGKESQISVNFTSPEAKKLTKRPARGPRPPASKHYRRDALT